MIDMYGTQMDIGLSGYAFDIDDVMYNKQAFVPEGEDIFFTWTWSVSGNTIQDGEYGTIYAADPIDTADTSGSYFVPNQDINCTDKLDPDEDECPDD